MFEDDRIEKLQFRATRQEPAEYIYSCRVCGKDELTLVVLTCPGCHDEVVKNEGELCPECYAEVWEAKKDEH